MQEDGAPKCPSCSLTQCILVAELRTQAAAKLREMPRLSILTGSFSSLVESSSYLFHFPCRNFSLISTTPVQTYTHTHTQSELYILLHVSTMPGTVPRSYGAPGDCQVLFHFLLANIESSDYHNTTPLQTPTLPSQTSIPQSWLKNFNFRLRSASCCL